MSMPWPISPGVVQDETFLSATNHANDADGIRWKQGRAETLPGYVDDDPNFRAVGLPRNLLQWDDNSGRAWKSIGTSSKLYGILADLKADITPISREATVVGGTTTQNGSPVVTVVDPSHGAATGAVAYAYSALSGAAIGSAGYLGNPFTTVEGDSRVIVDHAAHGLPNGSLVTFSGADPSGGITIVGEHSIVLLDADSYFVDGGALATDSVTGGGTVHFQAAVPYPMVVVDPSTIQLTLPADCTADNTSTGTIYLAYEINPGRIDEASPGGFGMGGFGEGPFGTAASFGSKAASHPRTWSLCKWGEFLLALPRGGTPYYWTNRISQRAQALENAPVQADLMFVSDQRQILLFGTITTDGLYDPLGIRWCSVALNTDWLPTSSNTAGEARLQYGSECVAAQPSQGGFYVWTDTAFFTGTYTSNLDSLYDFVRVATGAGSAGPMAAVAKDGNAYWYTPSGAFYQYTGGEAAEISCPSKTATRTRMDPHQQFKIVAWFDILYGAVTWHFPTPDTKEISFYQRLDTREQVDALSGWSPGSTNMTARSTDGEDGTGWSVRVDGMLCQQGVGLSAAGDPVDRFIEYGPVYSAMLDDAPGRDDKVVIRRLEWDAIQSGSLSISLGLRDRATSAPNWVSYGTVTPTTDYIDARESARYISLRAESNGAGDSWRWGTVRCMFSKGAPR